MTTVSYEWDLETWDGTGEDAECLDHQHGDRLVDVPWPVTKCERLVLVRSTYDDRMWAYAENWMLPSHFMVPGPDGSYHKTDVKVPRRFHREIARVACMGAR